MSPSKHKTVAQAAAKAIQDDISEVVAEVGDAFNGRRILITGGAGFLGSWLCGVTVQSGAKVTCIDNMSTGREENISHLLSSSRESFTFVNGNV